jgi:GntR family transcriptional regulator
VIVILYSGCAKPLYEQMKKIIIQKINSGEYLPEQSLPGERVLMKQFGVSRITIRQAIGDLVNEGILYRRHGKGTYVANKRIERPLARLLGIAEELAAENRDIAIRLLESGVRVPTAEIGQALGLNPLESVFMVKRLVITEQIPLLIIYDYFPDAIKYVFESCMLDRDIFYAQLEACGYKIGHGEQRIGAGAANQDEAHHLKYQKGAPVLVVRRTTFDTNHTPLAYSHITYRGDRYEYFITLKRNTNHPE